MSKLISGATLVAFALIVPALAIPQTTRDTSTVMNDAWISTQVYAKFFMDPDIKGRNIKVDTMSGVVTLTGTVESGAERNQAIAKAKTTDGVKQVVDKLSLAQAEKPLPSAPHEKNSKSASENAEQVKAHAKSVADRVGKEVSDTWITTKVQAMYFLDRDVKGMNIDVSTKGSVVTLTGTVTSEAARQKAVADARSIEGVSQVIDRLTVKNGKR